jgi:hypothetical protein
LYRNNFKNQYIMKKKLLYYGMFIMTFSNFTFAQTQIGSNIIGAVLGEDTGTSVSISSTILGDIVAIGTPYNDQAITMGGYVKVYQRSGSVWNQKGQTLNAEAASDYFGEVKLSGNGTRMVIGAKFNDGNGTSSGHVRVFSFDSGTSTWVQMGTDINGEAAGDEFGTTVAISYSGTVIAVGAPKNNLNGTTANSGHVRVYEWNGTAWAQKGVDINGSSAGDEFGASLGMSPDGTKFVASSILSSLSDGYTKVYTWNGSAWTQKGATITDGVSNDKSGTSVGISSDGNTVVIGAPNAGTSGQGNVKAYSYGGSSWTQFGSTISGWVNGGNLGTSISLSDSGDAMVVGMPSFINGAFTFAGLMVYYRHNGTAWASVGTTVLGGGSNDELGSSVAISADGNKVTVGAPFTNNTTGYARIYDYTTLLSKTEFTLNDSFKMYPNPSSSYFQLDGDFEIEKVAIYSLQGQIIKTFKNQNQYNVSDLSKGIYIVKIEASEGLASKTLIVE